MSGPSTPRFHSLRARLAAGILGAVALLVGWEVYRVQRTEMLEVETDARDRVAQDMALLQSTLEFAFAEGAVEQVERALTARGVDPSVDVLVLVDDAGRIASSRRRHEVGLAAEEVLGEGVPEDMMDAARDRQVGGVRVSRDGRRVVATYPVVLGVLPGQLRADRIGVAVAVHNLDHERAEVRHRLLRRTGELAGAGLAAAAAVLGLGQILVGRRVRMLVGATERLANGDVDVRARVPGTDELALIGAAFDAMAARVGETQRSLAESEARYRTLVEAAPVGILRIDATGRVVDANAAWREMTGGNGHNWPTAVHPDDRERVQREWDAARAARRPAHAECRLARPDGRVVWVHAQGVLEREVAQGAPGFIVTAVDLTERHQAEQVRVRLEARLRQAQKLEALGTLASGVAHDFNNVLAAVLGHVKALAEEIAGHPTAEPHVRRVIEAAEHGRAMAREILEFARPGLRHVHDVPIAPLVQEVARLLEPSLPGNVALRVAVDPDVPPVLADPDQLRRVLANLGTNAWQAMRPRGGVLEIGAHGLSAEDAGAREVAGLRTGPAVLLWVRDEGCGMDDATRAHIFEPFFTTKPAGEGTGLGLAVAHGIVQAHGGGIVVDSEPGKGTTFSIYLPATAQGPTAREPTPVAAARVSASPAHVLYVDDDAALLELAERAFRRLGHQVTTFGDPRAALAAFQADPARFDLVVTDQRMPGMLGEQLARAVLQCRRDVPVVVMSGSVEPDEAERLRSSSGARAVVEKPMDVDELVALCVQVLAELQGARRPPGA